VMTSVAEADWARASPRRTPRAPTVDPGRGSAAMLLNLQRSAGNAAVTRHLARQHRSVSEHGRSEALSVQRCGPTPCDCSSEERADYAEKHPLEEAKDPVQRLVITEPPSEARPQVQRSEVAVQRKGFESTVDVCHRVLESRQFHVANGGLRVVLMPRPVDASVPGCRDFTFGVTLTRSRDWWPDDEIGTCKASTGASRSFSFANLTTGTYYLIVWRNFDNPHCCLSGDLMVFDEPVASDSEGCRRDKDPSAMDIVHGALDLAGFVPVLGAIPDGINAGLYALEGDWANAGLSAVAMVPAWGDGVKLGTIGAKSAIRVSEKAAVRLGEEGIAKGLKEVKAASKVEKAGTEAAEGAAKTTKTEKELTEEAWKKEKDAAEEAGKKTGGGGKWTCYARSAVLQIPSQLPEHKCPLDGQYWEGPSISAPSQFAACKAAKHAFNAMMPRGCRPKHLDCRCSKR
jgi:hypothetical protein